MGQRILLADVETTGLSSSDDICEIAFVEIDEDLAILDSFSSLVKPGVPISPDAAGACGITNRMVADKLPLGPTLSAAGYLPGYFKDVFLIAHNAQFDYRFLSKHWEIAGRACTMKGARQCWPNAPNHKLQTLRHYLEIEIDDTVQAHRADADVLVLHGLLRKILDVRDLSLAEWVEAVSESQQVDTMPWGKHRGTRLAELPDSYIGWLLSLPDLDEDLRLSLERVITNGRN